MKTAPLPIAVRDTFEAIREHEALTGCLVLKKEHCATDYVIWADGGATVMLKRAQPLMRKNYFPAAAATFANVNGRILIQCALVREFEDMMDAADADMLLDDLLNGLERELEQISDTVVWQ